MKKLKLLLLIISLLFLASSSNTYASSGTMTINSLSASGNSVTLYYGNFSPPLDKEVLGCQVFVNGTLDSNHGHWPCDASSVTINIGGYKSQLEDGDQFQVVLNFQYIDPTYRYYSNIYTYSTNNPPSVSSISGQTMNEGDAYSASSSFMDSDSTSWTATVDYGDGSGVNLLPLTPDKTFSLNHTYKDNGTYTVTVSITDNQGAQGTRTAVVTVSNANPSVGAITTSINPVQVNTSTTASASFTDPGILDTHTATWNWGDGTTSTGTVIETNGSGTVSGSHTYTSPGVYEITLTVIDNNNGQGINTYQYQTVYDPNAGWVAGSKEYQSPEGALTGSPTIQGTVDFGFQVKYQQGDMVPSGKNIEFRFPDGNIAFTSTAYNWLVVNGTKVTFKATGILNNQSGYTMLVSARDQGNGQPSGLIRFQIKDSTNTVVYDTQPGAPDTTDPTTPVTKGKIKVH